MMFNLAFSQPIATQTVQFYQTNQGARIYQLPLEAFPGFWVYAYLVLFENYWVLIDTGSGYGACNHQLADHFRQITLEYHADFGIDQITHVLITHGHIDHFGGLPYLRRLNNALIGVHELDLGILTNTEEYQQRVSDRLKHFLVEAGASHDQRGEIIQLYNLSRLGYESVGVNFTYERVGMAVGPFKMLHVPGHSPGQVVIQLHDVLFSGDHILSDISPHQTPERLVLNAGLEHYLNSLKDLKQISGDIRLTLGGHNEVITDLNERIDAIRELHQRRISTIINILTTPHTISEVADQLFYDVEGYNQLLALEEAGAHVEYLYQRGRLRIYNLNELIKSDESVPVSYLSI
jgi:glyoxylase-like metal-dependent hydrolase (beta-lactamase superfamily II)